jgi:hypothetical protein
MSTTLLKPSNKPIKISSSIKVSYKFSKDALTRLEAASQLSS